MDIEKIKEFYDAYVDKQESQGLHALIYSLYNRMIRLGLNRNSKVYEIGCGIGVLTYLLAKKITHGSLEAIDISPKSIALARMKTGGTRVSIHEADAVTFVPQNLDVDFITLFDVMEHIPQERHDQLFRQLALSMGETTQLLINIPNPDFIAYDQIHHPEQLQIVDQSLQLTDLLNSFEKSNWEVVLFERYGVWHQNEYIFLQVRKKRPFQPQKNQVKPGIIDRVRLKTWRWRYRKNL